MTTTNRLKTLVLQELQKEANSGYGLIKNIYESTGWKPSYGSIYPLLEQLRKEKTISCKEVGRKKVYSLTKKSEGHTELNQEDKAIMIQNMREQFNTMAKIFGCTGPEHQELMEMGLRMLEKGEKPFKEVEGSITKFKLAFLRLHTANKVQKEQKKINTIILTATKELEKLL